MKKRHKWTKEQLDYLREGCKTYSRPEMAERLNKKFGLNLTPTQVRTATAIHNIPYTVAPRYNRLPVGEERMSAGYVYVKVDETGIHKKDWKLKQRIVWERAHGVIPEGHSLIFLDRDPTNCSLDNLMMVTTHEILILNRLGLLSEHAEINLSAIQIARVLAKANELERKGRKTHD